MESGRSHSHGGRSIRSAIRVLLVDDVPEDRARIAEIVTHDVVPVELIEVEDHVGFFQCLRESRYDVVITEQDLHWSSGHEVMNAVKALRPTVPVIMVASNNDEATAGAAFRDGLDAYITKSGELAVRLRASLRSACRRLEFEQRIDRLEDRLEHLLSILEVALFRATATGELLEANAAFQRLFGPILDQRGTPRQLAELFCHVEAYSDFNDRLASNGVVRGHQTRLLRTDGSSAWVSLSATLRRGPAAVMVIDGIAEDVSADREARRALEQARDELRAVFEHSGAAIAVLEADGTIATVNSAFERFSGYARSELEGAESWSRFLSLSDSDRASDSRRSLLASPAQSVRSERVEFISRDGRRRPVHATETALPGGRRSVVFLVDISGRQRVEERLLHSAFHDGLTGLPNRLSLLERLAVLEQRHMWGDASGCALVLFDLDGFKQVNDRFGHRFGDVLLRAIVRRVEGAVGIFDTMARCGSDTFALLLHPLTARAAAVSVAEAVVEAVGTPFRFGNRAIQCSVSVGVAWARDRSELAGLFRDAETAMYEARRAGGGTLRVHGEVDGGPAADPDGTAPASHHDRRSERPPVQ